MDAREIIGLSALSCCLGGLVTDQTQKPHTVWKQQGHKNIKDQIRSGCHGEKAE